MRLHLINSLNLIKTVVFYSVVLAYAGIQALCLRSISRDKLQHPGFPRSRERREIAYVSLLILSCIGLFACSSTSSTAVPVTVQPAPVDTTVSAYLQHHPDALQTLQANNIQLLQLGDNDRFVLPSIKIFGGLGSRIQASFYPMLDQIIQIIQAVPKESITVQAYMFGNNPQDIALKLTNLQAAAVSTYLMSHGVNARLIYSIGMGNHNQVTQSPDRLLESYRVEITLKELRTRLPG